MPKDPRTHPTHGVHSCLHVVVVVPAVHMLAHALHPGSDLDINQRRQVAFLGRESQSWSSNPDAAHSFPLLPSVETLGFNATLSPLLHCSFCTTKKTTRALLGEGDGCNHDVAHADCDHHLPPIVRESLL